MKTHPFAPSSGRYEDHEGLDEEHILHIRQQIQKKLQEALWRTGTYWLRKLQQVSPQLSPKQGEHLGGSGQQSCAQTPIQQDREKLNKNGYNKSTQSTRTKR